MKEKQASRHVGYLWLEHWKRIVSLLSLFAPLVVCGPHASSGPADEAGVENVEARIERVISSLAPVIQVEGEPPQRYALSGRMEHYGVPGVSVAVLNRGALDWARGFGVVDVETGDRVTPETLFQAASISKPVAGLAVLRLVEEGIIELDRDVNDYLQSWKIPPGKQSAEQPVTVRGLLSHTAGMSVHGFPGYAFSDVVPTVAQVLDGQPPANTVPIRNELIPGSEWRYSGGGYTVLQLLVTGVTGKEFAPLLDGKVFEPLGLEHSTYRQPLPEPWLKKASSGHDGQGDPIGGRFHTYPELAAAGLWTTPTDLVTIAMEVQSSLRGTSDRILTQAMTREMLRPGLNEWGLGFSTFDSGGHRYFGHGGSNAGFRARLVASLEGDFGAAIMTNGEQGNDLAEELLRAIASENGWPGFKSEERKVFRLDETVKREIAGRYEVPGLGELEIVLEGTELFLEGILVEHERLLASGPDKLFMLNGREISVERGANGSVNAITSSGFVGLKKATSRPE